MVSLHPLVSAWIMPVLLLILCCWCTLSTRSTLSTSSPDEPTETLMEKLNSKYRCVKKESFRIQTNGSQAMDLRKENGQLKVGFRTWDEGVQLHLPIKFSYLALTPNQSTLIFNFILDKYDASISCKDLILNYTSLDKSCKPAEGDWNPGVCKGECAESLFEMSCDWSNNTLPVKSNDVSYFLTFGNIWTSKDYGKFPCKWRTQFPDPKYRLLVKVKDVLGDHLAETESVEDCIKSNEQPKLPEDKSSELFSFADCWIQWPFITLILLAVVLFLVLIVLLLLLLLCYWPLRKPAKEEKKPEQKPKRPNMWWRTAEISKRRKPREPSQGCEEERDREVTSDRAVPAGDSETVALETTTYEGQTKDAPPRRKSRPAEDGGKDVAPLKKKGRGPIEVPETVEPDLINARHGNRV